MKKDKKILLMRRVPSDFDFKSSYMEMLVEYLITWGNKVYVYDYRTRKYFDFNNKKSIQYLSFLSFLDDTMARHIINIIGFLIFTFNNKKIYDLVNIMYLREEYLVFHRLVYKLSDKLYISVFGSDVNFNRKFKKYFTQIYDKADKILFTNEQLGGKVVDFFTDEEKKKEIEAKFEVIMLPLKSIAILDKEVGEIEIQSIKNKLNIDAKDINIVCGTCAQIELEQLYPLVDAVSSGREVNSKKNIKFIFSLSYGGEKEKVNKFIKYTTDRLGEQNTCYITDYLDMVEMLALRCISDIFINLRKNDQLAASMIESLYCNTFVLVGDWLPYMVLKEKGFKYYTLDHISQLQIKIDTIIGEMKNGEKESLKKNKVLIDQLWHPKNTLKEWKRVYNS